MKVLFISPFYKPYLGGVERVIEILISKFVQDQRVTDVGVLTSKWEFPGNPRDHRKYHGNLVNQEKIDGATIFRIDSWPHTAPPFYQVPLVWFSPLSICRAIKQFQPDVIQIIGDRWFWGNFWSYILRGKANVFYSLTFHELTVGKDTNMGLWFFKQLLRPINAYLTRKVDRIQVVSNLEKDLITKAYWTPSDKMVKIPWGIGVAKDAVNIKEKSGPTVKLLAVGRVCKHKGQAYLVKQYFQLNLGVPTELYLVGRIDEPIVEKMIDQYIKHNPDSNKKVHLLGHVSDDELLNLYQNSDLFVLFPEYESFGLVFLEAMSYGMPVLTHNVGAISEILTQGAIITDKYNKAQTKAMLTKMIVDAEFRSKLGKQAQVFVNHNYSWQKTADEFVKLYQDV